MSIESPLDLLERLVSLASSAETQMTQALPKMAEAADNGNLVEAFEHHLEETEGQLERLGRAVDAIDGLRVKRVKDHVMAALIQDGEDLVEATEPGPVRDAALIGAAQKVEHYEIAAYGTICALADQLGFGEATDLFTHTLREEKATDQKLTDLADREVSKHAK